MHIQLLLEIFLSLCLCNRCCCVGCAVVVHIHGCLSVQDLLLFVHDLFLYELLGMLSVHALLLLLFFFLLHVLLIVKSKLQEDNLAHDDPSHPVVSAEWSRDRR